MPFGLKSVDFDYLQCTFCHGCTAGFPRSVPSVASPPVIPSAYDLHSTGFRYYSTIPSSNCSTAGFNSINGLNQGIYSKQHFLPFQHLSLSAIDGIARRMAGIWFMPKMVNCIIFLMSVWLSMFLHMATCVTTKKASD